MNLMLPDSGLLFWMTIIFLIVFAILAKFGFPVITGMVEKRTRRIEEALAQASEAEERLSHLAQEQKRIIDQTRKEQARILQEAAAERDRMIALAKEAAAEEAGKVMEEAREKLREEKEAALRDVRREVALLSVTIAEKIICKEMSSDGSQQELLDRLTDEMSHVSPGA